MERDFGRFLRLPRGSQRHGPCQRTKRRRGRLALCLAIGLALGSVRGLARGIESEPFSEQEVRAVYLYNFAVFIDWPESAFTSPTAPMRFCVLGNRGLQANLEQILWGERIGGRRLELIEAEDPAHWSSCHLLYVDHSFQSLITSVMNQVRGRPVLTIGDSEDFAQHGGMIGLVRRGGRLRTFINREALAGVGIRVSSKLLQLSTLVTGGTAPTP